MGKKYDWDENLIQDFLLDSIIHGLDISDKDFMSDIYSEIAQLLLFFIENENDLKYLDFNISGDGDYSKIIVNNAVTALWFIGLFPENAEIVMNTNKYYIEDREYIFNDKTLQLSHTTI